MADAVAALERGFGSFKERSRSPKRKAVWPAPVPDFYKDVVGVLGVKDGHGLLLEEAFPVDPVPLSRQVLGARRKKARRLRPPSPPCRRYFRKSAQVAKSEQETSWQVAVAAAAAEVGKSQELPGEGAPDFLPLLTASAQLGAPSWAAACRGARLAALRARCQHAPGDVSNWLDFAEFQWSQLGEELDAPPRQVREKQRAVLEAALGKQSGPPDVRLIRALAAAEGDGAANMPVQELLAVRRQRLLQCSHAEVAEELVWGFLEVCLLGGAGHKDGSLLEGAPLLRGLPAPEAEPTPLESFRRAVLETLAFLAVRKVAAGHDGQAIAALERAELACISCMAFAEAAAGRSTKAFELVRGVATLSVFFPNGPGDVSLFASVWKSRCRLGCRGALRALQGLQLCGAELAEALAPLAQQLDASEEPLEPPPEKPRHGHLCALLRPGGGRLRNWCADELQRAMSLGGLPEPEITFEELEPFLVAFRTEETRKEAAFRCLDLLGAPTLGRHAQSSRYRQAFMEAFAPLSLHMRLEDDDQNRVPPHGTLPALPHRETTISHCALQCLAIWPRESLLQEVLVRSLRKLSADPMESRKLPRRVLRASEDPRLYLSYAEGLWASGAREDARQVLLKLCAPKQAVDARMAMAWWHLEGKSVLSQRLLLALAFQCFDETVLSDSPLDARESGLRRLQGLARLQQQLPRLSKEDAAGSLLSSYQSVVLAVCALLAQRSSRKALDFFLKEVPAADGDDRLMAMTMDAGPVRPTAATKAAAELARNWAKVAEHLVTLVQADAPSTQVEAIRICLRLDPGSPFALRALARLRVRQGRGAALRRELDTVLGLHRPTRLGASSAQWLESFRVALEAELSLEALGARARLGHLCEKALALASPIAGGGLWSLYGLVLLVKLHQDIAAGRKTGAGEELWRSSVRATSHQPLCKSLWLLNLAACEARGEGDAPEEEVIDLVEAIEAKQIFLRGDPLEAIA